MISQVLSPEQVKRIDQASLTILEQIGVEVPHPEMLSRFADSGAVVDRKTHRVSIPPDLVKQSVASAGKRFTLYGRDRTRSACFGQGKRNYNSIAGEAMWVDRVGGERRYTTMDDVATASRFGDAMEGLTIVGAMSDPHELPASYRCVEVLATMIKHTTKPVTFWFHDRPSARYIIDMVIALRGGIREAEAYPLCYPFLEPISPLRFPFNGIDLLYETARINLPVPIGPMAQMGLTAPGTVVGTLAQENAEILAGICITQLVRKGMPVCYGGICHAFDMGTTQMIFGGPEQAIFGVAMTQMGKYYGLPVYINVGLTDSKRPDGQAGIECGITLAMGAAAGADIFGHMGICGVDQATSLDTLVLQNETIRYVESLMRNLDFSDEAIGLDVLKEVGSGGAFIDSSHTVEHFRKELWFPQLLDRNYYQAWLDQGAKPMEERCAERKNDILRNYEVEPIRDDLRKQLDEIVADAKRSLAKGG